MILVTGLLGLFSQRAHKQAKKASSSHTGLEEDTIAAVQPKPSSLSSSRPFHVS